VKRVQGNVSYTGDNFLPHGYYSPQYAPGDGYGNAKLGSGGDGRGQRRSWEEDVRVWYEEVGE